MNTVDLASAEPVKIDKRTSTWRDWLGIVASVGCAIHCAAMPFVFAYLPAWGLSFLADESFHKWMALACFLIAIAAFVPGLRKHGNWLPVSIGAFGLGFITFAAFGLAGECCPSCSAKNVAETEVTATEDGCEHCEECKQCNSQVSTVSSNNSVSTTDSESEGKEKKDLLAILAPWLTPFGGLLLVSAHLLNKRLGCLCSCCSSNQASESAD